MLYLQSLLKTLNREKTLTSSEIRTDILVYRFAFVAIALIVCWMVWNRFFSGKELVLLFAGCVCLFGCLDRLSLFKRELRRRDLSR